VHVMDQWTRPDPENPKKRVRKKRYGVGKRWLARWVDPDTRRERSETFDTKLAAEAFLATVNVRTREGTWVDPKAGQQTFRHFRERWLEMKRAKAESTFARYKGIAENRVAEKWDNRPVGGITKAAYKEWLAKLHADGLAASSVRQHHVIVHGVLELAVDDKAIQVNVAAVRRGDLPRLPEKRKKAISVEQVAEYLHFLEWPKPTEKQIARSGRRGGITNPPRQQGARAFGEVLLFSGLRFGEAARRDLGDLQGRHLVVEVALTTVGGRQVDTDTKGHRFRKVPLPMSVVTHIEEQNAGRTEGPLLPSVRGGRWHHGSWTRHHKRAVRDAGLPSGTTTHALRHTLVSMAIEAGADVKDVQKMVGHKSAKLTLDTYAEWFEGSLDPVADALESRVPERRMRG
jgi:integrase